ncbi:MAG TPA: glycosyltransferase family 2 protein, partial [Candidatus Acidoferrum sp.]|nr:glycosyltransferase family 2 protein [Candidatus Acidoferrum sp.]
MIRKVFKLENEPPTSAAMPSPEGEAQRVSISIVIPVYNSERTIGRLCDALIDSLASRWRLQIVLVDDGSKDGSAVACRRLHAAHAGIITCVLLSRNFGEHNAVMAGLNFVTGDYCVVMDDDFQNPPAEVEAMLSEALKGYDVVYACYPAKRHSLWRNLGCSLHNWMATHALQKPKGLYLSSFKLMSRFVVREIIQYTGPDPYLDAMILRATGNIGTVTVQHQPREEGQSGYTFRKLLALWSNMLVTFSVYPLRIIGIYGLIMAGVG